MRSSCRFGSPRRFQSLQEFGKLDRVDLAGLVVLTVVFVDDHRARDNEAIEICTRQSKDRSVPQEVPIPANPDIDGSNFGDSETLQNSGKLYYFDVREENVNALPRFWGLGAAQQELPVADRLGPYLEHPVEYPLVSHGVTHLEEVEDLIHEVVRSRSVGDQGHAAAEARDQQQTEDRTPSRDNGSGHRSTLPLCSRSERLAGRSAKACGAPPVAPRSAPSAAAKPGSSRDAPGFASMAALLRLSHRLSTGKTSPPGSRPASHPSPGVVRGSHHAGRGRSLQDRRLLVPQSTGGVRRSLSTRRHAPRRGHGRKSPNDRRKLSPSNLRIRVSPQPRSSMRCTSR